MKKLKYWIQVAIGLLFAFVIMSYRGLFEKTVLSDKVMAVCDGFTVAAFLYLCMGALLWVSSTGWFDIFGFAVKRAAHMFFPARFEDVEKGYYEYKVKKSKKRKVFAEHFTLMLGVIFLVISIILTAAWYMVV